MITAGRAALFSGFTVAAAMASLIAMPQRFLYSLGAAVGLFAALLAVLVVPALLRLAARASMPSRCAAARRSPTRPTAGTGWHEE